MLRHVFLLVLTITETYLHAQQFYTWAVIGAGPAGIVSVAQLLEHGVSENEIIWIDPEFSSGRIGKYYGNVPGNQKAGQFVHFLNESTIFASINSPAVAAMRAHDPELEYTLRLAADVFIDITHHLCTRVDWQQDTVQSLWSNQNLWWLKLNNKSICAQKVILATGSHPKKFYYEGIQEIPLDLALDEAKLHQYITHDDTIMVVGSSHSAFLVVKYLHDFGVKKIISVYNKEPLIGTIGGLAGITAYWVQNVLLNNPPDTIERVQFTPHTIQHHLRSCCKIVYAFGYEPNEILVNGSTCLSYDAKTGIIQKNLYGIGIAFPQPYITDEGMHVNLIGFNAFMYRAKNCMPIWLQQAFDETVSVSLPSMQENKNCKHASCFAHALTEWEGKWI